MMDSPEEVHFKDHTVEVRNLIRNRIVSGPFGPAWSRVVIPYGNSVRTVEKWLLDNTKGKFGHFSHGGKLALYFEDHKDAVLFRLKGEEEIAEDNEGLQL